MLRGSAVGYTGPMRSRYLATLVGLVGVMTAVAPTAAATGPPPTPVPRLSLSVPTSVPSGTEAVATGRITPLDPHGRVQLQLRAGRTWRPLASSSLRHGRFRVSFVLAGAEPANLRVVLYDSGRPVAHSPVRLVQVRAVAPSPAPSPPPAATAAPAPAPAAPVEPPPATDSIYWGAWIGPQFTGTAAPDDMAAVSDFETLSRKPLSLLETYEGWASCAEPSPECRPSTPFPRARLEKMRAYGAIPVFSWASEGVGSTTEQPEFQLADIIAGNFDSYLRQWATEAREWGHPFFLRFDWEMNGNWFPWSESVDGNHPGEFVEAWRHVHEIFTAVGATNVTWLWCPYSNTNGNLPSEAGLYPGDEYVDWTCLDGYNRGTSASPTAPYRSFDEVFRSDYRTITGAIAPSKPMLLGEVATSEHGGSKSEWIRNMFAELPTAYPKVRGLLWFDYYDQGNDWPLETSASATEAFAAGISDPRYLTNSFAAVANGPVPMP